MFQLLVSLGTEYKDLKSHLLMCPDLPSFKAVCNVIQREEVRKKVMNVDLSTGESEARVFVENKSVISDRPYRGRRPDLKCAHCECIGRSGIGHTKEKCWILHHEPNLKFNDDHRNQRNPLRNTYTLQAKVISAASLRRC